jgi:hypothetical protein
MCVVEAAGVELYNPLILRKLLVLQEAKSARNASLPGRRYKNGTNLSSSLTPSVASIPEVPNESRYFCAAKLESYCSEELQ